MITMFFFIIWVLFVYGYTQYYQSIHSNTDCKVVYIPKALDHDDTPIIPPSPDITLVEIEEEEDIIKQIPVSLEAIGNQPYQAIFESSSSGIII